jgi:antitoxin MazE
MECAMQTAIKKIGNSSGILLPKAVLAHLHLSAGDLIELDLQEGRVILSAVQRHPREGWAEAARALADAEDDKAAWAIFGNDGDEHL